MKFNAYIHIMESYNFEKAERSFKIKIVWNDLNCID